MTGSSSLEADRLLARDAVSDTPALRRRAAKLVKLGSRRKLAKAIERLLRDSGGPVYAPAAPGALGRLARRATNRR